MAESSESMDSAEVCVSVAGSLELEYKDWLCCWWGCAGRGYGSGAASGAVVGSLWWGEECDAPWGSGTLHCQTQEEQGSFVSPEAAVEPC